MSWVEDELLDSYDIEECIDLEEKWENGFHIDESGKEYKLEELTTQHLKNIINYFKGYNLEHLKKELKKRNKIN